MKSNTILGIPIKKQSEKEVLEEIIKYIKLGTKFCHIVSLNPENCVIVQDNDEFNRIVKTAQITIPDGVGVVLAAQILGVPIEARITGVDIMKQLIEIAQMMRIRVLLIGGRSNLAIRLAECYQKKYPEAKFLGINGYNDVQNQSKTDDDEIMTIVRRYKPHLIFVAFGSPSQELWIERHNKKLKGIVCMGVGQAFDVFGKKVSRAPVWIRKIGFEWLYRLITQPWRWRRQLRLIKFIWLVLQQKISNL